MVTGEDAWLECRRFVVVGCHLLRQFFHSPLSIVPSFSGVGRNAASAIIIDCATTKKKQKQCSGITRTKCQKEHEFSVAVWSSTKQGTVDGTDVIWKLTVSLIWSSSSSLLLFSSLSSFSPPSSLSPPSLLPLPLPSFSSSSPPAPLPSPTHGSSSNLTLPGCEFSAKRWKLSN